MSEAGKVFKILFWIHQVVLGVPSMFFALELVTKGKATGIINVIGVFLAWIGGTLVWGLAAIIHQNLPPKPPGYGVYFSEALPGGGERRESRRAQEQLQQDRREGVFRPDGVMENTPYRVLPNGEAEAMTQGGVVRFQSLNHLRSIMNVKGPEEPVETPDDLHSLIEGIRYKINDDDTVTAKTPIGIRTYDSWEAFLRAINKKSWEPRS